MSISCSENLFHARNKKDFKNVIFKSIISTLNPPLAIKKQEKTPPILKNFLIFTLKLQKSSNHGNKLLAHFLPTIFFVFALKIAFCYQIEYFEFSPLLGIFSYYGSFPDDKMIVKTMVEFVLCIFNWKNEKIKNWECSEWYSNDQKYNFCNVLCKILPVLMNFRLFSLYFVKTLNIFEILSIFCKFSLHFENSLNIFGILPLFWKFSQYFVSFLDIQFSHIICRIQLKLPYQSISLNRNSHLISIQSNSPIQFSSFHVQKKRLSNFDVSYPTY